VAVGASAIDTGDIGPRALCAEPKEYVAPAPAAAAASKPATVSQRRVFGRRGGDSLAGGGARIPSDFARGSSTTGAAVGGAMSDARWTTPEFSSAGASLEEFADSRPSFARSLRFA
jgi:hypothetical protein